MMRLVLVLMAALFALPAAAAQPNFLVVVSDDLGWADLGSFGRTGPSPTPNLDRLAADGTKYTNFYAAAFCSPSRDGLLTGRHPQRNGITTALGINATQGVQPRDVLLPEVLRGLGYRTALIGKWHLGHAIDVQSPINNGFDVFYGSRAGELFNYTKHPDKLGRIDWWESFQRNLTPEYSTTAITREADAFITESAGQPWFTVVSYNAPHFPVQLPGDLRVGFNDKPHYDQVVGIMDDGIGHLRQRLSELGIADNTVVIFFADNGGVGIHVQAFRGEKGSVYEGGWHVPMIAKIPGQAAGVDRQVRIVQDLFPTIVRMAGGALTGPKLDGRDFAVTTERDVFLWQDGNRAIRRGNWKLVMLGSRAELYNLTNDPKEARNVAGANPGMVNSMKAALATWQAQVTKW